MWQFAHSWTVIISLCDLAAATMSGSRAGWRNAECARKSAVHGIVWYTKFKSRRHDSPNNIKPGFHGGRVFTNVLYKKELRVNMCI